MAWIGTYRNRFQRFEVGLDLVGYGRIILFLQRAAGVLIFNFRGLL